MFKSVLKLLNTRTNAEKNRFHVARRQLFYFVNESQDTRRNGSMLVYEDLVQTNSPPTICCPKWTNLSNVPIRKPEVLDFSFLNTNCLSKNPVKSLLG